MKITLNGQDKLRVTEKGHIHECLNCGLEYIKSSQLSITQWRKNKYCSIQCRNFGITDHGMSHSKIFINYGHK